MVFAVSGVAPANPAKALQSTVRPGNPMAAFLSAATPKAYDPDPIPAWAPPVVSAPATAAEISMPAMSDEKSKTRAQGIVARLKTASLFQGLAAEELDRIANAVKLLSYTPGSTLLKAGDPGERYYLLAAGKVDVIQVDKDGTEKVLSSLGAGQGVGGTGSVGRVPR